MSLDEPPILVNQPGKRRKRFRWEVAFVCACVLTVGIGVAWVIHVFLTWRPEGPRQRVKHIRGLTNRAELVATLFDWAHSTNSDEPTEEARAAAQALSQYPHMLMGKFTNQANGRVGISICNMIPRDLEYVFVAEEDRDLPDMFRHSAQIETNIFIWHDTSNR